MDTSSQFLMQTAIKTTNLSECSKVKIIIYQKGQKYIIFI